MHSIKKYFKLLFNCLILFTITTTIFAAPTINNTNTMNTTKVPLIPRKILFGNPEKAMPTVSPRGDKIAFLAPVKRVLNIWVTNGTDLARAKPVTKEIKRDIRGYFWSFENNYLLYVQDQKGDENFHLYRVDLKTGKIKDLTPFPAIRVAVFKMSQKFPQEILIGLNKRNPEWHDVYRLNIVTGKLTLVEENNRFSGFVADEDLKLRIAKKSTPKNSSEYYTKNSKGKWELYEEVPFEDELSTFFIGFNREGTIAYKMDSQNRDKTAFYAADLSTKQKSLLAESDKADCNDLLFHPTELTPQAFSYEYTKVEWNVLDKRIAEDFSYLKKSVPGNFEVADRSLADDKWIVRYYSDVKPSRYYLYERDPKTNKPLHLTFLFSVRPSLENQPLVTMQPVIIKTRDGLDLVGYLTLPPKELQLDPKKGLLPMILFVHGGPWARDSWDFSSRHQWLANRGYAVLSVNFRGSTGFGKAFINAGNKEWGGKMHSDLIDAVNWAVKEKIADPKKIAIMGGSYGGYATLVGLTFTPDVFCCGVSIVGPSNLFTLIKSVPPYWKPEMALFKKRIGDIDTEDGRKLLAARSPLTHVDKIQKPLLILQGEHDPRVKKAESDQIANKMKEKGLPVTYVLYHDEGHGFVREPNSLSSNVIIEKFLADNLGGRFEKKAKDEFKGANFSILEGQTKL